MKPAHREIASEKSHLRARMEQWWHDLEEGDRDSRSRSLCNALIHSPLLRGIDRLLLFFPLRSEPDLTILFDHFAGTATTLVFPRVERDTAKGTRWLGLYAADPANPTAWKIRRGLREPDPSACPEVTLARVDRILVPGLAFSPGAGTRLGRGGGFYDRLLAREEIRATTIGVCFQPQLHHSLPREPHDRPVHYIATEEGVRLTGAEGKP